MAYLTAKLNKIISKDAKFNKIISCLDNVCEIDVYEFKCHLNYFCESLKRWFDDTNIYFEKIKGIFYETVHAVP